MKKIYIASPFFNDRECEVLSEVETLLKSRDLDVYSPREHEERDGNVGKPEWSKETFEKDKAAIDWCDIVVMLYWGNYSDSGTAWECGYAFGTKKPIVVLHLGESSNLMVHESAHANLLSIEELKIYDFDRMDRITYTGKMF